MRNNQQTTGWLDNFNDSNISVPKNFVGMGNDIIGRKFSPAWGGQFKQGGELKKLDQLTNFNNLGQSRKNWLQQYK